MENPLDRDIAIFPAISAPLPSRPFPNDDKYEWSWIGTLITATIEYLWHHGKGKGENVCGGGEGGLTGQKKLNATRISPMDGDVKLDFFWLVVMGPLSGDDVQDALLLSSGFSRGCFVRSGFKVDLGFRGWMQGLIGGLNDDGVENGIEQDLF